MTFCTIIFVTHKENEIQRKSNFVTRLFNTQLLITPRAWNWFRNCQFQFHSSGTEFRKYQFQFPFQAPITPNFELLQFLRNHKR